MFLSCVINKFNIPSFHTTLQLNNGEVEKAPEKESVNLSSGFGSVDDFLTLWILFNLPGFSLFTYRVGIKPNFITSGDFMRMEWDNICESDF